MKGLILAGGTGSRLRPLTISVSKHILPIYNKPMIYYPLSTLILSGIRDIGVVCNPHHLDLYKSLLGDGSDLGIKITYCIQKEPLGIPQTIIAASQFVEDSSLCLILGDNIFYGPGLGRQLSVNRELEGALAFAYQVKEPWNYGVVSIGESGNVELLEEKPVRPKSNLAVPGMYFLDNSTHEKVLRLSPSSRGELEILDLLELYRQEGALRVEVLPRGTVWLDAGSFESLHDASAYVRITEERTGLSIGNPLDAARAMGWSS